MVVPFTLARLFTGQGREGLKRNYPYLIILALQVVCLVFTFSRGALVALVVGCAVFSAFAIPRQQLTIFAGVMTALIVMGGLFFLALSFGWRIAPLSKHAMVLRSDIHATRQVSNMDRLSVWKRTLPMIAGSLLIGYGPDRYAAAYAQYYPLQADDAVPNTTGWDPHNLVLEELTSAGLLGLLAFGWIVYIFYRTVYRRFRNVEQIPVRLLGAALMASAAAYLVQAQFNPSGIVAVVIFWLVMGIGCGKY